MKPENYFTSSCRIEAANDTMQEPYNALFDHLAATIPNVSTVSITDAICPGGVCVPVVDGMVIRYDGNHFTAAAAEWLAPTLYRQLVAAGVVK
jgi:hypothetical protein